MVYVSLHLSILFLSISLFLPPTFMPEKNFVFLLVFRLREFRTPESIHQKWLGNIAVWCLVLPPFFPIYSKMLH